MKRLIVVLALAVGAVAIAYASLKKTSSNKQAIEKKTEKQEKKKECKKKCMYS